MLGARQLSGEHLLSWQWSVCSARLGAHQWPDCKEVVTVVASWFWIPFWRTQVFYHVSWDWVCTACTVEEWSISRVPLICCRESLLQKHTFYCLSKVIEPEPHKTTFFFHSTLYWIHTIIFWWQWSSYISRKWTYRVVHFFFPWV